MLEPVGSKMDASKIACDDDKHVVDLLKFEIILVDLENYVPKESRQTRICKRWAIRPPAAVSPSSSLSKSYVNINDQSNG